jgi:molybdenum cofactor cytidylyltransferase
MKTNLIEVYGIVPASGFSRRMGSQKLLLPWRNKALLEHVLETTNLSALNGVFTVIPDGDMERKRIALNTGVHVITNTKPEKGIGHSLALGISQIPDTADAVMILLGDQPELHLEDIERVLSCFMNIYSDNRQSSKLIAQTRYTDGKIGHPILFSKEFFPALAGLEGDRGGNKIIQTNDRYVNYVNSQYPYPPDIDTKSEYEYLLAR